LIAASKYFRLISVLMLCIIVGNGCSQSDKNLAQREKQDSARNEESLLTEEADKPLTIHIDKTVYNLKANKEETKRYKGIEKITNSFIKRRKEPDSVSVRYVDFTGHGKPEKVVAHIFKDNGYFRISHVIYLNDKSIYSDTLKPYDDLSHNDRFEYYDSVNKKLEPYASFYDALEMIPLEIRDQTASEFIDNEVTLGMRRNVLEKQKLSDDEIEKQLEGFKTYLKNFKGKLLTTDTEDAGVWIWYEPEKKFYDLYEP
jgi:hypothetical protein